MDSSSEGYPAADAVAYAVAFWIAFVAGPFEASFVDAKRMES